MSWYKIDDGKTIGQLGSEGGSIIVDEEYESTARITLESGGGTAPYSITCGIYGWMVHTRFFSTLENSRVEMELMKAKLSSIVNGIPLEENAKDEDYNRIVSELSEFVDQFP